MKVSGQGSSLVYHWYVVVLLMLAQTISFIDRMILGLLVGPVRSAFDISDTQFSLLAGMAFAVFYAFMGLPLARIADRYSRKTLITVGILFWSAMTSLCGLASSYATLFLARIGVGVGEASLSPAAYSMITDSFPKKLLGRALSIYTLGIAIGSGLAYLIGGRVVAYVSKMGVVDLPILGVIQGWQLTFLIVSLPGLILAGFFYLSVNEPKRRGIIGEGTSIPPSEIIAFIKQRWRAIVLHILGMSIFVMVVFSLNMWGPTYLIRTFAYTPPEAGLIMGLILAVGAGLGLLVGGYLGDRWLAAGHYDSYSRVILFSMAGTLPFTVALGMGLSAPLAIACLAVATFFSGFQGGIAGGLLQLMTPNQMRGQIVALYFLTANLIGFGLGPTVLAACTDYIFKDDAAIGKSIALSAAILIPLAAAIMIASLKHVRIAVRDMVLDDPSISELR